MDGAAIFLLLVGLYFLPTIIAGSRGHHSGGAIFALNLLLGWTFLGWVAALVWSLAYVIPEATPEAANSPKGPVAAFVGVAAVVAVIAIMYQVGQRPAQTPSYSPRPQATYERLPPARPPLETASISAPEKQPSPGEKVKREAERVHWCRAELKKPQEKRSPKVERLCTNEQSYGRQDIPKRK